ncbi:hypothetical protein V6N12_051389 [Hibiscus sabdariffa]|uniref:Secreted protein n=1 Tax=Hibiscus sabdariffa TaxID=183260 RepID=A0ABR2GF59_9ROSI
MLLIGIFCLVRYYGSCGSAQECMVACSHARENIPVTMSWLGNRFCGVNHNRVGASSATCGGVVRDKEGAWVVGFLRWLGVCYVFEAEL